MSQKLGNRSSGDLFVALFPFRWSFITPLDLRYFLSGGGNGKIHGMKDGIASATCREVKAMFSRREAAMAELPIEICLQRPIPVGFELSGDQKWQLSVWNVS